MSTLTKAFLEIDGSHGEGGGQILRTALTLSMLTDTPFRITGIRGGRPKPGLLRQHLTCVEAAARISNAEVEGMALGSQKLSFVPGAIRGGDYRFAIGTAGSCTLVLQTVLPALWFADGPGTVTLQGGTHNHFAPSADFLSDTWQPLMLRMGVRQTMSLVRHGFYPAGGGEIAVTTEPLTALAPIDLCVRGHLLGLEVEALVAGLPASIGQRELEHVAAAMPDIRQHLRQLPAQQGPGNALTIAVCHSGVTEQFTALGRKGISAEQVANEAIHAARGYLASDAAVGEYLADQLLIPMALAGGGSFTATDASSHLRTNIAMVEKFLPVEITTEPLKTGAILIRIRT